MYGSITLGGSNPGSVILVHGGFLKIAAYGGLVSLASFLAFYLLMVWYVVKDYRSRDISLNKCAAYCALILLFMLIPMNIGADCFGLSLTWMSVCFLFINSQIPQYSEGFNSRLTRIKKAALQH